MSAAAFDARQLSLIAGEIFAGIDTAQGHLALEPLTDGLTRSAARSLSQVGSHHEGASHAFACD